MMIIKMICICLIIFVLWFMQMGYKKMWLNESELNLKLLEFNLKLSETYSEELNKAEIEKQNISRELLAREKQYNKLLEDYNNLKNKNNRIAEVIEEEKSNG